jgi:hypothetical protein
MMDSTARTRQFTRGGWRIEPTGEWRAAAPAQVEEFVARVVEAIEDPKGGRYYRSRHATTYRLHITDRAGGTLELFIKTFDSPRGLAALKGRLRGGRAGNVVRMTAALHRAGFNTPRVVLWGTHRTSGRTMLATIRAEGSPLPEAIQDSPGGGSPLRRRALMRALGAEVARLHRAGFVHGDLTPYNVFVVDGEPPRFIFLDHDRTRPSFVAGRRYRQLRNLVQLGRFDLEGLSTTDRLRFFRGYGAGLDYVAYRAMLRRVARMLARRLRQDAD